MRINSEGGKTNGNSKEIAFDKIVITRKDTNYSEGLDK